MATNRPNPQSGRETRLLLLVVCVSVAVLLLLARWRFPSADLSTVTPSAAPLAGLAARATFDEMGNSIADVLGRVSPAMVQIALGTGVDKAGARAARGPNGRIADGRPAGRRAIGLRVGRDTALVHVPSGLQPVELFDATKPLEIVSADPTRELALVRVAETGGNQDLFSNALRSFSGLSYVVMLEPSPAGPTIQPVFIGRAASTIDPRWSHPLIVVGAAPRLSVGAFVFSLSSRLVGLVIPTDEGEAVLPASALETMIAALAPPGTPQ